MERQIARLYILFLPLRFFTPVLCVAEAKAGEPEVELLEDAGGSRSTAGTSAKTVTVL